MNKEQRQTHLDKWAESGKSKKAYSESVGLKYQTFISWFKKKKENIRGRFQRIGSSPTQSELRIDFPNGVSLHVWQELTKELLKTLKDV